jgi:hypothetical protein
VARREEQVDMIELQQQHSGIVAAWHEKLTLFTKPVALDHAHNHLGFVVA